MHSYGELPAAIFLGGFPKNTCDSSNGLHSSWVRIPWTWRRNFVFYFLFSCQRKKCFCYGMTTRVCLSVIGTRNPTLSFFIWWIPCYLAPLLFICACNYFFFSCIYLRLSGLPHPPPPPPKKNKVKYIPMFHNNSNLVRVNKLKKYFKYI